MAISYNKLWKLLIDKKMGRTEMALNAGVTKNVLARLSKAEPADGDKCGDKIIEERT